jgi:RNA polymerase sigma-70 factor (ECF subfamily)
MNRGKIREKFERAFDEYSDAIFRYCYFRTHDRERSKELVQECFVRAWEYAVKGEEIKNIRAFLYRIAHNLVVNEYRDKKYISSLEEMSINTGFDPPTDMRTPIEEAETQEVVAWLDTLAPMYRDIMVLRYVEDLPVKEIATLLGQTETAISVKIHRAIKKLQEIAT